MKWWVGRRRGRRERGAVAVEAALVTPLLMVLVFGIIEMSMLMRDVVSISGSVRAGARVASASPGGGPGTCQASADPPPCSPASTPALAQAAADAIAKSGSAMPKDSISSVMIYSANTAGYPLPAGNTALTCSTKCVTYVWDKALDKFRYSSGTWSSSSINACVNHAGQEVVGVAMKAKHAWVTGLFGNTLDLTDRSVMTFEPLPSDQCMPGTHL